MAAITAAAAASLNRMWLSHAPAGHGIPSRQGVPCCWLTGSAHGAVVAAGGDHHLGLHDVGVLDGRDRGGRADHAVRIRLNTRAQGISPPLRWASIATPECARSQPTVQEWHPLPCNAMAEHAAQHQCWQLGCWICTAGSNACVAPNPRPTSPCTSGCHGSGTPGSSWSQHHPHTCRGRVQG